MYKKKNVFEKEIIIPAFGLLALMFMIGSIFDYQISDAVLHPNNWYGIFLAGYGQAPSSICAAVAGCLLICIRPGNKKDIFFWIFGTVLTLIAAIMLAVEPVKYMKGLSMIVSIVISLILVLITDILTIKMTKNADREDLKKFIILLVGTVILQLVIVNVIKVLWGRPRMRMIVKTEEAAFQSWWVIGSGMKEKLMALGVAAGEFKSFPSGHTANSACAILLGALPLVNEKLVKRGKQLFLIGFLFAWMVAVSRIIVGAHFLTDVTAGLSITLLNMIILEKVL